jgi:hypothetical protein
MFFNRRDGLGVLGFLGFLCGARFIDDGFR